MELGIGLPSAVAGTGGDDLVEFARRADSAGFSTLGTIDRLVYDNYEPLTALAAAAAVTERIRLATSILIVPYRANAALLAKQAASVHALSGGRLLLGVSVGGREDDYEVSHVDFARRGGRMDEMLSELGDAWSSDTIGPGGSPDLIVGGQAPASFRRAAEHGIGWMLGGGTPEQLAEGKAKAEAAWSEAGRDGKPRIMALGYYSLGPQAEENANRDLKHYYAWLGDYADQIAASAATDEETVQAYLSAFEQAGCDEFIFFPCSSDPEQVDLLADAALPVASS
jgi:alkanesulfonate monooxygenase SsuD/methylene tetrahydromethanopterin reductase-like flavin-dependent oxidoreductase (luciferase family)